MIAVVSSSSQARQEVADLLGRAGIQPVVGIDRVVLAEGHDVPDLIIVCGPHPVAATAAIKDVPKLAGISLLAIVPALPEDSAAAALMAGAIDVFEGDLNPAVLGARCRLLLKVDQSSQELTEINALQAALLDVERLVAAGGDAPETLRAVMMRAAETLDYERGSLIAHVEGAQYGYVIAATDDPNHQQFSLLMSDYPELTAALQTHQALIVDDVSKNAITKKLATKLADKGIGSMAVFPVIWRRKVLGAMFFRRAGVSPTRVPVRMVRFGQLLAAQLAATLRHGRVMERLRDQTRRISRASYEAERRLRTIESLKEHFEASADGVVVLDAEGRMLFVNGTAEAITGFARDGLIGAALTELVHADDHEPLKLVLRSVLAGTNLEAFDLDLITTGGGTICVSVTTSTVLSRSEAVILSFRDVTAQRSLEAELEQTKDFLEKLIDSAIDAIVSADMDGRIILFNSGAEAIFGYSAREVLGMPLANLYPENIAAQVLGMLRSTEHGGTGRLELTRREILSKHGERIPVNMTASIIYEEGEEVATVGIFTDLRERLLMEERLVHTERKLREREKQAAIAELAGAAAHELNQPLTSILATASMLVRNHGDEPTTARRLDVIVTEAERMAELVRKIGRIVRYETKAYVGSSSILDLERSSESDAQESDDPHPAEISQHDSREVSPKADRVVRRDLTDEGDPTKEHRFSRKARQWAKTVRIKPVGDNHE